MSKRLPPSNAKYHKGYPKTSTSDQAFVTSGRTLFFCIDSCGDMHEFDRLAEAIKHAESNLDEEGEDGWSEDIHQIHYGKILGGVFETMRRPREEHEPEDWDEVVDYAIKPLNDLDEFQVLTDAIGSVRSLRTEFPAMAEKLTLVIDNLKRLRKAST